MKRTGEISPYVLYLRDFANDRLNELRVGSVGASGVIGEVLGVFGDSVIDEGNAESAIPAIRNVAIKHISGLETHLVEAHDRFTRGSRIEHMSKVIHSAGTPFAVALLTIPSIAVYIPALIATVALMAALIHGYFDGQREKLASCREAISLREDILEMRHEMEHHGLTREERLRVRDYVSQLRLRLIELGSLNRLPTTD